jgi:hypothetical protein
MFANRLASALAIGALLGLGAAASVASAADMMPLKVKAPPPPEPLDIHGFGDVSFKNDYITPRGLLVTNTGLTTQILSGLVFDAYKDKSGWISDISFTAGIWNDLWSEQHNPVVDSWNEFDWFVSMDVKLAQDWTAGIEYIEFISPPHAFPGIEKNIQFHLSYDDSKWNMVLPLHPYVTVFWAASGPSTVVEGKAGGTYDVEIGINPTLDLNKSGIPVVFTTPTWVTVGPTTYWNNGATGCGASVLTPCATSNAGVVSTGLTGKTPLTFISKRLGSWYVDAGFQYYHIINDSLLLAQTVTGTATSFATAHRDIVVGFGGFGFGF